MRTLQRGQQPQATLLHADIQSQPQCQQRVVAGKRKKAASTSRTEADPTATHTKAPVPSSSVATLQDPTPTYYLSASSSYSAPEPKRYRDEHHTNPSWSQSPSLNPSTDPTSEQPDSYATSDTFSDVSANFIQVCCCATQEHANWSTGCPVVPETRRAREETPPGFRDGDVIPASIPLPRGNYVFVVTCVD